VTHAGAGHHAQHAVQETITGAQDRHQHQLLAVDHLARHGLQRRLDLDVLQRHVARDLVGHQGAQLIEQAAKTVGARVLLTHQRELVLNQGVGDDVEGDHEGPRQIAGASVHRK